MTLPAMKNFKEVFETTSETPQATIMEECIQDLNKTLSFDVRKLYNEKACNILVQFFRLMWTHG